MAKKSESVYIDTLHLEGEITINLNAEERSIICNALAKCAPKEVDIMPLLIISDRIITGRDRGVYA